MNVKPNKQAINAEQAVRRVAQAIVETAAEAGPLGAPSGVMYAALNGAGIPLDVYQRIVGFLKADGYLTERGHCLHATGKKYVA